MKLQSSTESNPHVGFGLFTFCFENLHTILTETNKNNPNTTAGCFWWKPVVFWYGSFSAIWIVMSPKYFNCKKNQKPLKSFQTCIAQMLIYEISNDVNYSFLKF